MCTVVNIGNTHTESAQWIDGAFRDFRVLETACLEPSAFAGAGPVLAASVVPARRRVLEQMPGWHWLDARTPGLPVDFSLADCRTLGADRVANAIAAAEFFPLPAVVFDFGTAITMEIVDRERRFCGGAIAPGRKLQRDALHCGTAQLPELPVGVPISDRPGCNTADAIAFGVDCGAVGMVREWMRVVELRYPGCSRIAAGGDAPFFLSCIDVLRPAGEYFTLHGIRLGLAANLLR